MDQTFETIEEKISQHEEVFPMRVGKIEHFENLLVKPRCTLDADGNDPDHNPP
jgi:hypothetical protein